MTDTNAIGSTAMFGPFTRTVH